MRVWQIATGEAGRDYRDLFVSHDIMVLGPSHLGNARESPYRDGVPNSAGNQVHNFAHRPKPGDRVLMRFGREVIGVGEIPAEDDEQYSFDERFRGVYGWDLCHTRRVKWGDGAELGELANVYAQAKQKPSFTGVNETHIREFIEGIDAKYFERPLRDLPDVDPRMYSDDELGVELFKAGISNKNIDDILAAIRQAERLCNWYWSAESGRYPTEHEVVSHVVLPLFLGLGWSHQQMAVEWQRTDLAFFGRTPTTPENCVMVLEAKGLGTSLGNVLGQPQSYVESLGLDNVRYIVTTDGANLFVYERTGGRWNPDPVAYLSIAYRRREYPLPRGTNFVDTLVRLQPSAL